MAGFAAIAVLSLGGVVALGIAHPHAADARLAAYLPALTPVTVIGAGLLDGINPCAFTVLLLLIAALLAVTQVGGVPALPAVRGRVLLLGSIYVGAVFLTYLAVGAGLGGSRWAIRAAS